MKIEKKYKYLVVNLKKKIFTSLFIVLIYFPIFSQTNKRKIDFPNINGYYTLSTDFHQHTVFSDGNVWPTIRVQESFKDGLDAISLTEHLEYQPHSSDIPHPDRNRSYQLAKKYADNLNNSLQEKEKLLIINGQEITRKMPPGHINAIFIKNANLLLHKEDSIQGIIEANKQGAFLFWNHPAWPAQRSDGIAKLDSLHEYLISNNLIHGIEVVNELYYSEEALQIALDNNLTIMGTSDIHGLIDWLFDISNDKYDKEENNQFVIENHRPVTLVFAKEKTENGIKKALFDGNTAVYYNELLIGKKEFLKPLVENSLKMVKEENLQLGYSETGKSSITKVKIINIANAPFILKNKSQFTFETKNDVILIPSKSTTEISIKTTNKINVDNFTFFVLNAITAPKQYLEIDLKLESQETSLNN